MTTKIVINGFGCMVFRAAVQNFKDVEIVGINDLLELEYWAYMLTYDRVHGRFKGTVAVEGNTQVVNGQEICLTQERDPVNLKWRGDPRHPRQADRHGVSRAHVRRVSGGPDRRAGHLPPPMPKSAPK